MATIRDIAERVGVSVSTVSRVLNMDATINVADETRVNIFQAAEEMEYVPRRSRKGTEEPEPRQPKEIAIIYWYDYEQEVADPYYLSIRLGIEERAEELGYSARVVRPNALEKLTHNEVGILVLGRIDECYISTLKEQYENVIIIDNDFTKPGFDYVGSNLEAATRNALEYLYKLGHRRIARIGGAPVKDDDVFVDSRDKAYCSFMKEKGLYDESLISYSDFNLKGAYHTTAEMLASENRPTALLVSNDSLAIGTYRAIGEAGLRIPEDISVLSFNDSPNAKYMMPPLNSVRIRTKYIGAAAVDLLYEREHSQREYCKVVLIPTELKVRRSCGEASIK